MYIVNFPSAGFRLIVGSRDEAREWMRFYAAMGLSSACTPM